MAKHTNFRIGGPARWYVVASTAEEILAAVCAAEDAGVPWYVFGGGSNLLVSDEGFDGLMIQAANRDVRIEGSRVICEAGAITVAVARACAEAGLAGFEWAAGIPGTIGGAIYGNAGCYGGEMKDAIVSVDAYRLADHQRISLANAECRFGYRDSLFKHERYLILGCTLELRAGDRETSLATIAEIQAKRKASQPLGESSAGCMFKNFEYQDESELDVLRRTVEIPPDMLVAHRIGAGWLIQQAGLCGERIGEAEVSPKHGNFLVNHGGATARDVIALIRLCQSRVRERFGIELEEEVRTI